MNPLRYRAFRFLYAFDRWRTRRFTPTGTAFTASLILTGILQADSTGSLIYQVFTFTGAIVGLSTLYSFRFREKFRLRRTLPRFGTVGVPLQYRITIENGTDRWQRSLKLMENFADPRPSYRELRNTPEPGEHRRNRLDQSLGYYRWLWLIRRNLRATTATVTVPPIPPRSSVEVTLPLYPHSRGPVHLAEVFILRPDPFGLFHACQCLPLPQSLWILPHRYPLPPLQLLGGRRYQSGGVALASAIGESDEFMSLRDYRPGDPLRKIHWKSWAKVNKPIVREDQDEFFVRHALILDTFQREAYSEKLEEAIAIAASCASSFQSQESLLDLMFVGLEAYCFTAGRGVGHLDQMLEILASVQACSTQSFNSLQPLVLERADLLSGCICIFLSWDDDRQALVQQLEALRVPTLVLLLAEPGQTEADFDRRPLTAPTTQFRTIPLDRIAPTLMTL
ncbi:MAG: DUF58 domain-containing protein [Prochlorothrix sp.]|nr:DUF58 domain-containing protein [Prochlorothrix sp.]